MSTELFLVLWYLTGVVGVYLLIIRGSEYLHLSDLVVWVLCSWLGGLALFFGLLEIYMDWEAKLPSFKNPFYRKGN